LAQSVCAVVAGAVLTLVRLPKPAAARPFADGRPLTEVARQPRFIAAVACGLASYTLMNLIMTAAPLAMVMCNHSVGEAALGLQWHVIGMFAPSFFTGTLIMHFGLRTVMTTGLMLIAAAAVVGLLGLALWNFWLALALLGVGWNFSFIGATTLVTECHGPRERNKVQAFNDFLVFGSMAFGSFLSGPAADALRLGRGQRDRFPGPHRRRPAVRLGVDHTPAGAGVNAAQATPPCASLGGAQIQARCRRPRRSAG
jgi:hypothetical protein